MRGRGRAGRDPPRPVARGDEQPLDARDGADERPAVERERPGAGPQARVRRAGDRGHVAGAALAKPGLVVARIGLVGQERRAERRPPVRRHEAEPDRSRSASRGAPGAVASSMSASSRTWRGARSPSSSSTITPQNGRIGRQVPLGIDERRRPRARGDDDRARGSRRRRPRRRRSRPGRRRADARVHALDDRRATGAGERGEARASPTPGATGKPIASRHADEARREGRLQASRARRRRRTRCGCPGAPPANAARDRPQRRLRPGRREDPGRLRREAEGALRRGGRQRGGQLVRERAVPRERLAVQLGEDRVDGMPHDARVAARCPGRDRRPLVQRDRAPRPASSAASAVPTIPPPRIATSGAGTASATAGRR